MIDPRRAFCTVVALIALSAVIGSTSAAQQRDGDGDQKPTLAMRATPPVGFTPLRVSASVDVRGGADDYAEFYCAAVEWEWGDGTMSESSSDCDPYEAGQSTIERRFRAEHVYRQAGTYRVVFRLKQRDRTVAFTSARVQVRPGIRDGFGG